ncbi:protein kinase domain-containing protein [Metabacillus sp. RGM 3146]|uniref:protein kinase domain-containing protein n=1 Tax=Metabacillus sp. RGM 3146 TaxID=3401092 RepID=UPI003B9D6CB4
MMNSTTANQECKVPPGTIISGKWHGNQYQIIKPLGHGANGVVYLAKGKAGYSALKLSENSMSITSEVNVLKHFSKVRDSSLGPFLHDVDDWLKPGRSSAIAFYAMEYIQGPAYLDFIKGKGSEWISVLVIQLLSSLEQLHMGGWIFGDLKPDNLIVSSSPVKLRFVDVGGTTQKGRAIKEFTDFFDRGYWGMGNRKADAGYDLFAVAMIIINSAYPKRFSRNGEGKQLLFRKIEEHPYLKKHKRLLQKALCGEYINAEEMRVDLIRNLKYEEKTVRAPVKKQVSVNKQTSPAQSNHSAAPKRRAQKRKRKRITGFLDAVLVLTGLFVLYMLYIYHFLLP